MLEDRLETVARHPHFGSITLAFDRIDSKWTATVWCSHQHSPMTQVGDTITMAVGRLLTQMDVQTTLDNWRGVDC